MTEITQICQKYFKIFLFLALFICLSFPATSRAIGQLTKDIVVNDALRGQEFEESMTLANSEKFVHMFELAAEKDIADWVKFYEMDDAERSNPISTTSIEANGRKGVIAKFLVPDDAPNGEYTGFLSVLYSPADVAGTTTQATVKQKIARRVAINVSDKEIIDFDTNIIPQEYGYTIGDPMKFKIVYINNGNIAIKPQVQIRTRQIDTVYYNVINPYPEDMEPVKPRQSVELPLINVPTDGVQTGKINVEVAILNNGEVVKNKDFLISVNPKTDAEENSESGNAHPSPLTSDKFLYLLGLAVIVIAGATYAIKTRKNK